MWAILGAMTSLPLHQVVLGNFDGFYYCGKNSAAANLRFLPILNR